MTPAFVTKTGVEIMDEDEIPEGQVWFTVPIANGGKATYMLTLADWRMTLANGDPTFIDELDRWLDRLATTVETGNPAFGVAQIGLIREAIAGFKHGQAWTKQRE